MNDYLNQDGLQDYLKQIGDHRRLTAKEETDLAKRIEAGDTQARDELVSCNLLLVVKLALKYRNCGVPLVDLIQEGNIGLLNVVERYDWRKGFRFSTYAAFWIHQEIQNAVRSNTAMIRLPVRKSRLLGRVKDAIEQFTMHEGREPGIEELAEFLGEEVSRIESVLPSREPVVSLDSVQHPDGRSLMDTIADTAVSASDSLHDEQSRAQVHKVVNCLPEIERRVLAERFGLGGGTALSLRKVSRKVGLSQEGVRRVEQRALGRLRRPAYSSQLQGTLTA